MNMKVKSTTEKELREEEAAWPKTIEELQEYIQSLVELQHDYGTCVYAMSMAACATLNYVASTLGCTGFQASCADLDIIRRQRMIKGPLLILKGDDMLYPQFDVQEKLQQLRESSKDWLRDEAKKLLKKPKEGVHPAVWAHWKKLAEAE